MVKQAKKKLSTRKSMAQLKAIVEKIKSKQELDKDVNVEDIALENNLIYALLSGRLWYQESVILRAGFLSADADHIVYC